MIYRIIAYLMFGFLVIAFVLSFAGVQEVYLGNGFRNWLSMVNDTFNNWSFEIPKIPDIPLLDDGASFVRASYRATNVVTVPIASTTNSHLIGIVNMLFTFFNFLIKIINVLIVILNIFIKVIQFALTMVYCVKDIPSYLNGDTWASFDGSNTVWWWRDIESFDLGDLQFNF